MENTHFVLSFKLICRKNFFKVLRTFFPRWDGISKDKGRIIEREVGMIKMLARASDNKWKQGARKGVSRGKQE